LPATPSPEIESRREASTEDLNERLHFLERWRCCLAVFESIEKLTIAVRHGRDVLRLLLSTFALEADDPRLGERRELVMGCKVLGGDQEAAIQLSARGRVGQ